MATLRTFECDLCRRNYGKREEAAKSLVGIKFGCDGIALTPQPVLDAETHICRRCLSDVAALARASGLEELPSGAPSTNF